MIEQHPQLERTIGILAGAGDMPATAAAVLRAAGRRVVVAGLAETGAGDPGADEFEQISIGKAGRVVEFFRERGARQLIIVGKLEKRFNFLDFEFDELALQILARLQDRADSSVFAAVLDALNEQGLEVLPQTAALAALLCPTGALGARDAAEHRADVARGLELARGVAGLDIGQAVALRQGLCVAVEAFEHTDAMIRRAGELAGPGCVVAKVPRPRQDPRLDVPTIGPGTIRALAAAGCRGLALQAGAVFVMERELTIRLADEHGIFVVGEPLRED